MKVTIKMIAEKAGVHPATVDKVLHNRVGVSDEVRQRIKEIIREMDYHPNPAGRLLQKQGVRYRLAAVLVQVDALPFLLDGIRKGIADQTGFNIELLEYTTPFYDALSQAKLIRKLTEEKVDGIVVTPIQSSSVAEAVNLAEQAGIPVVTANSDISESERLCYVGQDGEQASRVAGRIMGLLLGGRGSIAIVSSSIDTENNSYYVTVRERGFREFIQSEYPDIRIAGIVENFEDPLITYTETRRILREHPEVAGVYVTSGGAAQVGKAVLDSGKAGNVRVITYEDYPDILELMKKGVIDVTLSSELEKQGELPVKLIMDWLVLGKKPECRTLFTDIRVLFRESIV